MMKENTSNAAEESSLIYDVRSTPISGHRIGPGYFPTSGEEVLIGVDPQRKSVSCLTGWKTTPSQDLKRLLSYIIKTYGRESNRPSAAFALIESSQNIFRSSLKTWPNPA